MRAQLFYRARRQRGENWEQDKDKPVMERTIPVFRALIAAAPERSYHRNHGQLGYALKDQRQPDWSEAEKELSTAIDIRGPWKGTGWSLYEFNRAICRIMRDSNFREDTPAPAEAATREAIVTDLRVASLREEQIIKENEPIQRWLKVNKVKDAELAVDE